MFENRIQEILNCMHAPALGKLSSVPLRLQKKERLKQQANFELLSEINEYIGKLEDRDTQSQAYTFLRDAIDNKIVNSNIAKVFKLLEKNKQPKRASARRFVLFLMANLVASHAKTTTPLLPRLLKFLLLRLRDIESSIAEACGVLVGAITIHILPLLLHSKEPVDISTNELKVTTYQQVAVPLLQEIHISEKRYGEGIGFSATHAMCALIFPYTFDAISLSSCAIPLTKDLILVHCTNIYEFCEWLLSQLTLKSLKCSQLYHTFGPTFQMIGSIVHLAQSQARINQASTGDVKMIWDLLTPMISIILESIKDVLIYASGFHEWSVRVRGIDLLEKLLQAHCDVILSPNELDCFYTNREDIQQIIAIGRKDTSAKVREASLKTDTYIDEKVEKAYLAVGLTLKITIKEQTKRATLSPSRASFFPEARKNMRGSFQSFNNSNKNYSSSESLGTYLKPMSSLNLNKNSVLDTKTDEDEVLYFENENGDECLLPERRQSAIQDELRTKSASFDDTDVSVNSKKPAIEDKNGECLYFQDSYGDESIPSTAKDAVTSEPEIQQYTETKGSSEVNTQLEHKTPTDLALLATQLGEIDLAFRLCFLEDDFNFFIQFLSILGRSEQHISPILRSLSIPTIDALLATMLIPLSINADAIAVDEDPRLHHIWQILSWLSALSEKTEILNEIDQRIRRSLESRLMALSTTPTKLSLIAAKILVAFESRDPYSIPNLGRRH